MTPGQRLTAFPETGGEIGPENTGVLIGHSVSGSLDTTAEGRSIRRGKNVSLGGLKPDSNSKEEAPDLQIQSPQAMLGPPPTTQAALPSGTQV